MRLDEKYKLGYMAALEELLAWCKANQDTSMRSLIKKLDNYIKIKSSKKEIGEI